MVATEVALTGMAGTGAACRGTVQAALAATGGGFICSVDRHLSGWHRRGPHRAAQQLRNMAIYQHPGKKNSGSTNGGCGAFQSSNSTVPGKTLRICQLDLTVSSESSC